LDPFCGHEWNVNRPERRNRPEAGSAASLLMGAGNQETRFGVPMENMAESKRKGYITTDPFLTKYTANVLRPRIKVSITNGTMFPEFDGRCELYCVVSVPGIAKSRLSTPVDHQHWGNPVWNFRDKQIWGWIPGKALQLEVRNRAIKEGLNVLGMGEDALVGTARLTSEDFYPDGYKGTVDVRSQDTQIQGSLNVQIKAFTGQDRDCFQNFIHQMTMACEKGGEYLLEFCHKLPIYIQEFGTQMQLLLGKEYTTRIPGEKFTLIYPAIAIYVLVYFVFCYVGMFRHHSVAGLLLFFVACLFVAYMINLLNGSFKRKPLGAPRSILFGICFFAFAVSYLLALDGWNYAWAQWWWMFTGWKTEGSAATPAASRYDASSIAFANGTSWSSVDANRGAGYRTGGNVYCAAPVMDPAMVAADIPLINYWAIGINCCDDFGSFTCDASRSYKGGVGVAMVPKSSLIDGQRGLPCVGCNHEFFRLATLKSSAAFGLVSADEAVWIRYVSSRGVVTWEHFLRGVWNFIWSGVVLFCLVYLVAWTANFHGWGKPVNMISSDDARHQQAMRRTRVPEEKKRNEGYGIRMC